MQRLKLVIIGAGSAMFTRGLVADLILTGQPWLLALVDIDENALSVAAGLSRRMVQAKNADIIVQESLERRDLLPGADVVVTTVGVGGRRAWEADVFIPRRYGFYQPVGDTVMAGGISRALRMAPAMVAIARDVVALCPQAHFVNYANPMTVNCWAMRRATGAAVVGLCHGVMHVERDLARYVGVPPSEVTSLAAGVNHLTWLFDLHWRGRDMWPLLRARYAQERGQPFDRDLLDLPSQPTPAGAKHWHPSDSPFTWSLFEKYGAYPAVHDRHVTEFFPEHFPHGSYYGKTLGIDAFSFEATIAQGDRIFAEMEAQAKGLARLDEQIFQRAAGEHEQLLDIMASMAGDERRIFSANLPNAGAVPNLPPDAIVELPAAATASGFRSLSVPDFPEPLAEIILRRLESQELTVQAALTGDRALVVEALLADGGVRERGTAEALADDLIREQRQYLPQFA